MIKFIHKKHIREDDKNSKIVIYYNASDIFLGATLLILVVFFMHDYLSHALGVPKDNGATLINSMYGNKTGSNPR